MLYVHESNELLSICFMFYGRYVKNTLVVIKPEDLNRVHSALNNFDRNLNDVVPHFLDIEIYPEDFEIYCKPANTGQYVHYTSVSPWRYKTTKVPNIIHRATVLCDETKIQTELNRIKKLISWNDFPKQTGCTLIATKLKNINIENNKKQLINKNKENVDVIWINLPYSGRQGDQLLLSLKRKITRFLTKKVNSK